MKDTRRFLTAAFVGLSVGFALALWANPALRKKLKGFVDEHSGDFIRYATEAWSEYPKRVAFAIAAGREAARAKERELEKILSGSAGRRDVEEAEGAPKYII